MKACDFIKEFPEYKDLVVTGLIYLVAAWISTIYCFFFSLFRLSFTETVIKLYFSVLDTSIVYVWNVETPKFFLVNNNFNFSFGFSLTVRRKNMTSSKQESTTFHFQQVKQTWAKTIATPSLPHQTSMT